MNCACVILNYNDSRTTIHLLERIKEYDVFYRIVVVDNCSTDKSFEILRKKYSLLSKIIVIKTERNGGYGYGNNYGVKYSHETLGCNYVLISNPDVVFDENTIKELLSRITEKKNIAIITAKQLDRNNNVIKFKAWKVPTVREYTLSAEFLYYKTIGRKTMLYDESYFENKQDVEVGCVPGACILVSSSAYAAVGGYDTDIFLYGEETMLGIKFKNAGYRTLLANDLSYIHLHSISIDKTIKSSTRKKIMVLKSRYIILKKYLNATTVELIISKIVYFVATLEYVLINFIKKIQVKYAQKGNCNNF